MIYRTGRHDLCTMETLHYTEINEELENRNMRSFSAAV